MTPSERPNSPIAQQDYVRRAHAMLDAYPLFDVPRAEWVEVCHGLLTLLASEDAATSASEAPSRGLPVLGAAGLSPEAVPQTVHWSVQVTRNHETVVTIESNCMSGRDLQPGDDDVIRGAAQTLLGFVGQPRSDSEAVPQTVEQPGISKFAKCSCGKLNICAKDCPFRKADSVPHTKTTISYELIGRCFWHLECPKNAFKCGVMACVAHEPDRSVIECMSCGQRGYYPVGGLGPICCEVVAPVPPAEAIPQTGLPREEP